MIDKITNIKAFVVLVILRTITGLIAMPTVITSNDGLRTDTIYTPIDSIFRLISTLLMITLIVVALNALGNYSKYSEETNN